MSCPSQCFTLLTAAVHAYLPLQTATPLNMQQRTHAPSHNAACRVLPRPRHPPGSSHAHSLALNLVKAITCSCPKSSSVLAESSLPASHPWQCLSSPYSLTLKNLKPSSVHLHISTCKSPSQPPLALMPCRVLSYLLPVALHHSPSQPHPPALFSCLHIFS